MSRPQAEPNRSANRFLSVDLAANVEFLAARARAIGSSKANTALEEFGLRVRPYSVLSLACSGEHPSQRELADFLRLDPSQIVAIVDDLEKRKLVRRRADVRDRRSKIVIATAKGEELYATATAAVARATAVSLSALTPAEVETLRLLLWKVAFTEDQRAASTHEFGTAGVLSA
ncbi:MarR family winged helix-turn-helix transcriptional regulator [Sinomonas sp. ASV486]|uniref:MarR family winged helix-turn-helix transcriptional regulator n=1 Tax=Sinomonas sp. ASV486 TaxID=3051170 RepID=UPI0027DB7035|nr:MarR family winged helix-turn-helix transcriptional regulator [Sinomonas sp. ASV486]MDQ4489791.1 MarR family winged helix-turn-helix transcriptional regulator [Sinomonas sp. ASV486]